MKIIHEILGEIEVFFKNGLKLNLGTEINCKIKQLEKDKFVLLFEKEVEILGKKTPGLKLSKEQYLNIQNYSRIVNRKYSKY